MQIPRYIGLHSIKTSGPHLPQTIPPILLRNPEVVHGTAVERNVSLVQSEIRLVHRQPRIDPPSRVVLVEGWEIRAHGERHRATLTFTPRENNLKKVRDQCRGSNSTNSRKRELFHKYQELGAVDQNWLGPRTDAGVISSEWYGKVERVVGQSDNDPVPWTVFIFFESVELEIIDATLQTVLLSDA